MRAWGAFRRRVDLLELSHRGLQRQLIPAWLARPGEMSDRIESSAYGETPMAITERVLEELAVGPGTRFVDLGCGGGNICAAALSRGASVLGLERNPELLEAAKAFLEPLTGPPETRLNLLCADFLEADWGAAEAAYTVSARYPERVLRTLAERAHGSPALSAIACLGRPLPLPEIWSARPLETYSVTWNSGEQAMRETLFVYRRPAPSRPTSP